LPRWADFSAIVSASSNICISISFSLYMSLILCLTFVARAFLRVRSLYICLDQMSMCFLYFTGARAEPLRVLVKRGARASSTLACLHGRPFTTKR
jgi:hypothetical protein